MLVHHDPPARALLQHHRPPRKASSRPCAFTSNTARRVPHPSRVSEGWDIRPPNLLGGLRSLQCDAMMHHMRKASVRQLRYRFSEVEGLLRDGEEIQITKRKRVIARLVPAKPAAPSQRPDFLARLKRLYRGKPLRVTGAELVARDRGRF